MVRLHVGTCQAGTYLGVPTIFYESEIDLSRVESEILIFEYLWQLLNNFGSGMTNIALLSTDLLTERRDKELHFWLADGWPEGE